MSARDDQPVTVPPPAGEDDAYSATTKVGAMPADIMEKLRAEGLLPEERNTGDRETPASSFRPSTTLDRRTPMDTPLDSGAPLPTLYSTAPPAITLPPPADVPADATPALTGPPAPLETPVAFAFPPVSDPLPKIAQAAEESVEGVDRQEKTGAAALRKQLPTKVEAPPSKITFYVVAVLVVLLLIVALVRLRG